MKLVVMAGGKKPETVPSSPVDWDLAEISLGEVVSSARNEYTALKSACLKRDGHRCVVTGMIEQRDYGEMSLDDRGESHTCGTWCAYILPYALKTFDERSAREVRPQAP